MSISVIAATGGPCALKTTSLARLKQWLEDNGYTVYLVPETATHLKSSGITIERIGNIAFQVELLRHQIFVEDQWKRCATQDPSDRKVILCDRGTLDAMAYTRPEVWRTVLDALGANEDILRNHRYDAVLFLHSVAFDKPHLFTNENNAQREEGVAEAARINELTRDAWIGHPHLIEITNEGELEDKVSRVIDAACRVLGIPEPVEIERKYLVRDFNLAQLPFHRPVEITQHYLRHDLPDTIERIRRRQQGDAVSFYHTLKSGRTGITRSEFEREISQEEYEQLLERAFPQFFPIRKTRHCFSWNGLYFELDYFHQPEPGLMLLEVELTKETTQVTLPPFFENIIDVSEDDRYSNFALAQRIA